MLLPANIQLKTKIIKTSLDMNGSPSLYICYFLFQVVLMAFLLTFILKKDSDMAEYESILGKTKVDMETVSLNNQGTSPLVHCNAM